MHILGKKKKKNYTTNQISASEYLGSGHPERDQKIPVTHGLPMGCGLSQVTEMDNMSLANDFQWVR